MLKLRRTVGRAGGTADGRSGRRGPGTALARARRLLTYGLAVLLAVTTLTLADPGTEAAVARVNAPGPAARVPASAVVPAGTAVRVTAAACAGRMVKRMAFRTGELRVFQKGRYVCAVTVAHKAGAPRPMRLSIQVYGAWPVVDEGRYTRQAGPRKVHAPGRCVRATGSISGHGAKTGWILC
ncbi:hypothetical protein AB0G74_08325 [Streptomyces sp. NPDC020875]|uniref:hypothetical protein n=1 Tax=Streptomyces sp. NPDC020875 TaxID=3154898 RepID=UPI0033C44C50